MTDPAKDEAPEPLRNTDASWGGVEDVPSQLQAVMADRPPINIQAGAAAVDAQGAAGAMLGVNVPSLHITAPPSASPSPDTTPHTSVPVSGSDPVPSPPNQTVVPQVHDDDDSDEIPSPRLVTQEESAESSGKDGVVVDADGGVEDGAARAPPKGASRTVTVPMLLCAVVGPLCWLIGRTGWSFHYAIWCTLVVIIAIRDLRERLRLAAKIESRHVAFRKLALQEEETAEWLNALMYRVWPFHEPVLCEKLRVQLWSQLEAVRPSSINAFEIQRLTLGKRAPFISCPRTITRINYEPVPDDRVIIHMNMSFIAPELELVVAAKTAMGTIPVAIKDFTMQGRMRMEIDLVPRYPHAQTVTLTFLQRPLTDFDVIPLGMVNLMEVPYVADILSKRLVAMINENLLDPAKVVMNMMKPSEENQRVKCAGGILFLTILGAEYQGKGRSLIRRHKYSCKLVVGDDTLQTKEIEELPYEGGHTVEWQDTFALLAGKNVKSGAVSVQLRQKKIASYRTVASVNIPLKDLVSKGAAASGGSMTHMRAFEGDVSGFVKLGVSYVALPEIMVKDVESSSLPHSVPAPLTIEPALADTLTSFLPPEHARAAAAAVLQAATTGDSELKLSQGIEMSAGGAGGGDIASQGSLEVTQRPQTVCGALMVCVHAASELKGMDSNGLSDPFAILYSGDRELFRSKVVGKSLSPVWEQAAEFTVADINRVRLTLRLYDMDTFGTDDLGSVDLDVNALLPSPPSDDTEAVRSVGRRWFKIDPPTRWSFKFGNSGRDGRTATEIKGKEAALPLPLPHHADNSSWGYVCLSLYFRPVPHAGVPSSPFTACLGNATDEPSTAATPTPASAPTTPSTSRSTDVQDSDSRRYKIHTEDLVDDIDSASETSSTASLKPIDRVKDGAAKLFSRIKGGLKHSKGEKADASQ